MMNNKTLLEIAQLGKVVGLTGDLKLHDRSDFPEQYKKGASFSTQKGVELVVSSVNLGRGIIRFEGYESRESAQKLINSFLYTTQEATKEACSLDDEEFFWFDVEECLVYEGDLLLGVVDTIERIGDQDYLHVKTDKALCEKELSTSFLIPYIDRFIVKTDIEAKRIDVVDGLALLESS